MAAPNEITVSHLLRLIGLPDAPMIVDFSIDADFENDPFLIPGAFRHPHTAIAGLKERLAGRACIIVCQRGLKLSQGMSAHSHCDGVHAEYLQGDNFGWRDYSDAPRVTAAAIPPLVDGATLWVTRHRPKIDHIACPWLIRRFVDDGTQVLFVSLSDIHGVAERCQAAPFDVRRVFWSHRDDHCIFDTVLAEFGLTTPALSRLATVIRAADTNTHDLGPQAAGLLALSVDLSRQYRSDTLQLDAGMALYDALYRWARDEQDEGHDWPAERKA